MGQYQNNFLNLLDPANKSVRDAVPVSEPGYVEKLDGVRLRGQMKAVYELMKDRQYRTLSEIKTVIGRGTETGISAALRSFRKTQYGEHIVNRRRRGDPKSGLFEYQLIIKGAG